MSETTIFGATEDKMYYYIREANAAAFGMYEGHAEGYANHLELLSELNNGRVCIDGLHSFDMYLGDSFTLDTGPENALKCLHFVA